MPTPHDQSQEQHQGSPTPNSAVQRHNGNGTRRKAEAIQSSRPQSTEVHVQFSSSQPLSQKNPPKKQKKGNTKTKKDPNATKAHDGKPKTDKETRREINRLNAAKNRKRRKEIIAGLQHQLKVATKENEEARRLNDILKAQIKVMKEQNQIIAYRNERSGVSQAAVSQPSRSSSVPPLPPPLAQQVAPPTFSPALYQPPPPPPPQVHGLEVLLPLLQLLAWAATQQNNNNNNRQNTEQEKQSFQNKTSS